MSSGDQSVDILIVDDVPDNLRLLSRMLIRRGYQIWTAKSGQEALAFLQDEVPELILLDVNMPGMDGYDVCKHIKGDPRLHEIPVIFLSALSEPSDKLRGFDAGGVDYVTKPFHFHEVIARVETHLELYRQRQENERLREQERAGFERINELKDRVLNTATHDLKNPLTSIKLSVSLLRKMILDPEPKISRYLDKIEFDTDRMLQLITDLLDVATVEVSGPVAPKVVMLPRFLQRTVNQMADQLFDANVEVDIRGQEADLRVVFDAGQVGHVLQNLLGNLIKYTPPQGSILIGYGVSDSRLLIELGQQTAEGMSEQPLGLREKNNLDLGIALLQVIAEQHGGEIRQPDDDRVAFVLDLPVDPPPAEPVPR